MPRYRCQCIVVELLLPQLKPNEIQVIDHPENLEWRDVWIEASSPYEAHVSVELELYRCQLLVIDVFTETGERCDY